MGDDSEAAEKKGGFFRKLLKLASAARSWPRSSSS